MPRYAETLGIRRASQSNDRQVLPTPVMAHIKANVSATVADDRCVRRCAWPYEYFDPTRNKLRETQILPFLLALPTDPINGVWQGSSRALRQRVKRHCHRARSGKRRTPPATRPPRSD